VANIPERKLTFYDSLFHPTEGFQIMNSLTELFTEYIHRNKLKEDDGINFYPEGRAKTTLPSESLDEGNNRLSASFTSSVINLNEANFINTQVTEETYNFNQDRRLNLNSNGDSSDRDSDSENDLHMLSSFWKFRMIDTPKQTNGSDCGVFVCKYMDYLARHKPISFSQEDICYFRFLIGVEILEGRLMTY
jgi:hypothetical protein